VAERVPVDEGRIHEWLDGQLSAAEGAELEALVASDPAWADALAEARGLVAASRRITSALDDVPADVIPIGRPTSGAFEARALPARPVQVNARRPRFMLRTWRNVAAMMIVFVGSGVVWRMTQQKPAIASTTDVALAEPSASVLAPAPLEAGSAPSAPGAVAVQVPEKKAAADGARPLDAVADAAVASTGSPAAESDVSALRAAESAPPPLPSVMVPRVAQADSSASPARDQRRAAAADFTGAPASAPAARSAGLAVPGSSAGGNAALAAPMAAKAERARSGPRIAGLGERCVEAALFNPPAGWPTRVALEVGALGSGQMMAFVQFMGPVGGRWIGSGWRRGDGVVEVAPVQVVGSLQLSASEAKGAQGQAVGVLWSSCSPRSTLSM
jgi:hypothetical protein